VEHIPKVPHRSARTNAPITCCDFGVNRLIDFPHGDFCHPCKLWENRDPTNSRISRSSRRYACQRTHESLICPQMKERSWWDKSGAEEKRGEEEKESRSALSSPAASPLRIIFRRKGGIVAAAKYHGLRMVMRKKLNVAELDRNELQEKLVAAERRAKDAESRTEKYRTDLKKCQSSRRKADKLVKQLRLEKATSKPSCIKVGIHDALDQLIKDHYPRFRIKNLLNDIADALWLWREGICQDAFVDKAKKHLKENVFSLLNICRAMDLFGGMLNYQSLRVLRWIEIDALKDSSNLLFPAPTTLTGFISNFTGFCSHFVNVNFFKNNFGEGFEFNHKDLISLIWTYTGKDKVAEQQPTKLVLTSDGSKLTNNINVVLMGLKETEAYQSMPLIGSHLLKRSHNQDSEHDGTLSVQSAFLSFPVLAQLGPESADMIDGVFKRKYRSIMESTVADSQGQNIWFPNWKPFEVYCPSDQKFSWLATKAGGAAKVKKYFCQYCVTTSSEIDKANDNFCEYCLNLSEDSRSFPFPDVQWECLHQEFVTDAMVDRLREQLEVEYPPESREQHKEIQKNTKLKLFEDTGDIRAAEDKYSIDYNPQTIADVDSFNVFLSHEARLRRIFSWSTWRALRNELKARLRAEKSLEKLLGSFEHIKKKEDVLYFIQQAIPCILHLENRTLLKLFLLILRDGLSNAQGRLHQNTMNIASMQGREVKFIEEISRVMNEEILGSVDNVAQWKLPTESNRGENLKVGTLNIENYRGRKIMENFSALVDQCIVEDDKRQKWRYAVNNYNAAMVILRQRQNYTPEDILKFQLLIDRCYLVLRSMYKRDVATNYFHMLSSRHIAWFMESVGPLNNYSNQGFEALNRLMKRYLNTRTNKGGGRSKCKSKLRPIAYLFLRRLIWTFGVYKEYDPKITYTNGSTVDAEIFE
jgi:hypothetical protein